MALSFRSPSRGSRRNHRQIMAIILEMTALEDFRNRE